MLLGDRRQDAASCGVQDGRGWIPIGRGKRLHHHAAQDHQIIHEELGAFRRLTPMVEDDRDGLPVVVDVSGRISIADDRRQRFHDGRAIRFRNVLSRGKEFNRVSSGTPVIDLIGSLAIAVRRSSRCHRNEGLARSSVQGFELEVKIDSRRNRMCKGHDVSFCQRYARQGKAP